MQSLTFGIEPFEFELDYLLAPLFLYFSSIFELLNLKYHEKVACKHNMNQKRNSQG